jgi:hypothetical protein
MNLLHSLKTTEQGFDHPETGLAVILVGRIYRLSAVNHWYP